MMPLATGSATAAKTIGIVRELCMRYALCALRDSGMHFARSFLIIGNAVTNRHIN